MGALRQFRRRCCGEEGAELIEFALTLPILMVVLLGVIEFGFIFKEYEAVTNAAREGARLAVLPSGYTDADIEARANDYLTAAGLDTVVVTVGPATEEAVGALCVTTRTVTVPYPHTIAFLGGMVTLVGGSLDPITLTGTAKMRTETAAAACAP
jgi:Flp pilus assembly protein TadG